MTIPKKSIVNKSIAKGEDKQLVATRGQSTKEKPKTRAQGLVDAYELQFASKKQKVNGGKMKGNSQDPLNKVSTKIFKNSKIQSQLG